MTESLVAPLARARFVVTLPPEPSRIAEALERSSGQSFTTLTDTKDAFLHLARRAQERLVVLTPFMDATGASWAADIFEASVAKKKELVLRDSQALDACGPSAQRLRRCVTRIYDYELAHQRDPASAHTETFHAKIVLADGVAAYVGSANFLYRSREMNLECGFLLEGDAVGPVAVLVDAVLSIFGADEGISPHTIRL
jgi:phosphatidylserine/phosphatidylglycerophosphate/cardiolipin synthase-like enzyme